MSALTEASNQIRNIAVAGAGLMGHGIAYRFAAAGHNVFLQDTDEGALAGARRSILDICTMLDTPAGILDRIGTTTDAAEAVASADLVIEAATEVLGVKQQIFRTAETHAPQTCLFASNTSSIPIQGIAQVLQQPGRMLGAHFWNPPYAVHLVEVIQTPSNNAADIELLMGTLRDIGMVPVHVRRDVPGCIGNRLQHALKREAIALVAAGVCDAETIDVVCKAGFGSRLAVLGPLEQSDLVGLDLTEKILGNILPDLDNTADVPEYLRELVAKGHLGMKTGQGFRSWTPESASAVRERLQTFLAAAGKERNRD